MSALSSRSTNVLEGGKEAIQDQKTIRILYYSKKKCLFFFFYEWRRGTSLMGGTRKKHT